MNESNKKRNVLITLKSIFSEKKNDNTMSVISVTVVVTKITVGLSIKYYNFTQEHNNVILFFSNKISKPQNEPANLLTTHAGKMIQMTIGHLSSAEFGIWQAGRSLLNTKLPVTAISLLLSTDSSA
jgi:hypothetical protein